MWKKTYNTNAEIMAICQERTGGVLIAERFDDQTTIRRVGSNDIAISLEGRVNFMHFFENRLYLLLKDSESPSQATIAGLDLRNGRLTRESFVDASSIGFELASGCVYAWNSMFATQYFDASDSPKRLNTSPDPTLYFRAKLLFESGVPCFSALVEKQLEFPHAPTKIHLVEPGKREREWTMLLSRESSYHLLCGNGENILVDAEVPKLSPDEWSPVSMLNSYGDVLVCFKQKRCVFKTMLMLQLTDNRWGSEPLSGLKNFVLLPNEIVGKSATRVDLLTGESELHMFL